MRKHSTPDSALNLEITKLAIIECVFSITVFVVIGMYLGTFKYLATAIVLAPLSLFRTDVSAEWGFNLYERGLSFIHRFDLMSRLPDPFNIFVHQTCIALMGVSLRIGSVVYWTLRKPLESLRETPQNWMRQALCTDFFHPPEIMPLEATRRSDVKIPNFAYIMKLNWQGEGCLPGLFRTLITLPILLIGFLPSLVYRVSFKATSLAYLPLIWVVHITLRSPFRLKPRLERITKGELERVRRAVSWLIVTILVAKLALMFDWVDKGYLQSKFPSQKVIALFIIPDRWPWWQLTLGTDALLTFFLLFFADSALARLDYEQRWRDQRVMTTISAVSFVRGALSVLTISHFFHVALVAATPNLLRRLLT